MTKAKIILIILFLTGFLGLFFFGSVSAKEDTALSRCRETDAAKGEGTGIFEGVAACQECGDCSLCDFLLVFANLARWILSVMGGLAIIWFVWAGISFIISFGNQEKVESAKKMVIGVVFGITVILIAWLAVNFIFISFIGSGNEGEVVNIWKNVPWSTLNGMCPQKY